MLYPTTLLLPYYYPTTILTIYIVSEEDSQTRQQAIGHALASCKVLAETQYTTNIGRLREAIDPKPNTCCFTCYLPTRVCKGPLGTDSDICFSSQLLIVLWLSCARATWQSESDLLQTSYFDKDWWPKGFRANHFQTEGWRWDTEVIEGAVFFYYFALSYFSIHGWD